VGKALISIVSPVYGCIGCLEELVDTVRDTFEDTGLEWELILVDDRGPDNPWQRIQELAARDERVRGVRLTRNYGQHLAIWAGFAQAQGDWIAVIDCDLQDDPKIIPELYNKAIDDDLETVVVERGTWSDSWWRRTASRLFHSTIGLLAGLNLNNNVGNFGLYSRRMTNVLLSFEDQEVFLPAMVALTGLSKGVYKLDRSGRAEGQSSYNMLRLIRIAIAIIVRFTDRPLKLSIFLGVIFSTLSALISVIILIAWASGAFSVPGWTSIILSVWFLSGLILAVLGVHGVYIGRIFSEVQKRPRYIVEQTTMSDKE
jgi:dolichol-phosphate mannosyltransferase